MENRQRQMFFRCFVYFAAFLTLGYDLRDLSAQDKPDFSKFDYHVTEDRSFGLYKPWGWKVKTPIYPDSKIVVVTDEPNLSNVSMLFSEEADPTYDSVKFAGANLRKLREQDPDLIIREATCSSDRMRTIVKFQRGSPGDGLIEGRYSFHIKHPAAVAFRYEAPVRHFKERIPTLLTVVANITLQDPQAYQHLASNRKDGGTILPPMRDLTAPDQTCRLLVPEGWTFHAQKTQAVCTSPDGDTGYLLVTINFIGESQIPYFDSRNIPGDLRRNYLLPIDAFIVASQHNGFANHRVIERHSNTSYAKIFSGHLNRGVDAETALISFTGKSGVELSGYYDVLGLQPAKTGQWAIIAMGFWAPTAQFARHLPLLLKIGDSHRVNETWAKKYVQHGQNRLKEMMKGTSPMMSRYAEEIRQGGHESLQNRMRSGDFASKKYSALIRDEEEWVIKMEGGAIVKTDQWGLSIQGRYILEGPLFNHYDFRGERLGPAPIDISREVSEALEEFH